MNCLLLFIVLMRLPIIKKALISLALYVVLIMAFYCVMVIGLLPIDNCVWVETKNYA